MHSVVICEKPSQARNLQAALGDAHGEIYAAQGHLVRLQTPEEANPDWTWAGWSWQVLQPASGLYGLASDSGSGKPVRLKAIAGALKRASRVIVATDCDREGQAIADNILAHLGFQGEVLRAMFAAEDPKTLREAFAALRPNAQYAALYAAARARAQADQIYGLTLTRAATKGLQPAGQKGALGIGRVKTAVLALLCQRERAIQNHVAIWYCNFELTISGELAGASYSALLRWEPKGEDRLTDGATIQAVKAYLERVVSVGSPYAIGVDRGLKRQGPPKPPALPSLQRAASKWGWSAQKTLDVLQALYEAQLVTYPRAEVRHLPETMIAAAPDMLRALADSGRYVCPATATIRKGGAQTFSDAALKEKGASHHAVVPNPNTTGRYGVLYDSCNPDQQRLFDLIARMFLAAISPDMVYDETRFAVDVPLQGLVLPSRQSGEPMSFTRVGRVIRDPGWTAVWTDEEDEEGETILLPPFADGQDVRPTAVAARPGKTEPPPRYDEGSLIQAMEAAWRLVPEGPLRVRLKEASGIGTPATRAAILEGLKTQRQIALKGRTVIPTELGLQLYDVLHAAAPDLVDPVQTALLEERLDAVLRGRARVDEVVNEVAAQADRLMQAIREAAENGGRLSGEPRKASPKQRELLRKIYSERGLGRPSVEILNDAVKASRRLEELLGRRASPPDSPGAEGAASEKQITAIKAIMAKTKAGAPAGWPGITREQASSWLDAHAKRGKR